MNTEDFDDQQHWIDELLRHGATDAWEAPPASLRESFRAAVARQRRFNRLLAGGLAAAAMLLIATGSTVLRNSQRTNVVEHNVAAASDEVLSPATADPRVESRQATFVSNGESIAVPVESSSADVTIVRIYPTTDTEQRWRRELTMASIQSDSNGG